MTKAIKSVLGMMLTFAMLLAILPAAAMAAGGDGSQETPWLVSSEEELTAAAESGGHIQLQSDIELSQQLTITADVTLDGGGHKLSVAEGVTWETGNHGKYILVSYGNSVIHDLTIDAENEASGGIQFYKVAQGSLENVTVKNAKQIGLNVNASSVTVTGTLTLEGNGWGDIINVGWGSSVGEYDGNSVLNAENAVLSGVTLIYTDKSDVANAGDEGKFTINAPAGFVARGNLDSTNMAIAYAPAAVQVGEDRFATLAEAVAASNGETIELLGSVTLDEKLSIDKDVTIVGNNHTITGKSDDAGVYFEINGGTFTISDAVLTGFGDKADTVTGTGVFKIPASATGAKLVASGLKVEKFNRAAFDVRNGSFEITNSTIDCDNGQEKLLTKGVVAGYDAAGAVSGSISGCTITGSNSTYEGWSASGIEISSGANVTVSNTVISSMKGGISVARNYGSGAAEVTVNNSTITAMDYALRIFESNSTSSAVAGSSAILTVNGGKYSGDVRISVNGESDGSSTISITDGHFTADPGAFLAEGKTVVESTESGYLYTVTDKADDAAEVVVAGPEINTDVEYNEGSNEKELADAVGSALADGDPALDESALSAAAGAVANQGHPVTEEILSQLNDAISTDVEADDVTMVVQPYMDIRITGVSVGDDSSKTITLDITPMYSMIATTADVAQGEQIELDGASVNAVKIGEPQKLELTRPVTVTIPLPADFAQGDELYVKHEKDSGEIYYYTGTVEADVLSFVTLRGFSSFTLSNVTEAAAEIDGVGYATLQAAVDEVGSGQTITLLADGHSAVVSREISFTLVSNSHSFNLSAGTGYEMNEDNGVYTFTRQAVAPDTYTVNIDSAENGSVSADKNSSAQGDTVTLTVTPDEGYELSSITVTTVGGQAVELADIGEGKYTFTMPASDVTVKATFRAEGEQLPFSDVDSDDWFFEAVRYAYDNGIMDGMGGGRFAPNSKLTRGMMVTVLWRLEGEPTGSEAAFDDVSENAWYAEAVNWAAENGIVNGYGDSKFDPNGEITREQMAVMILRYAQHKSHDVSAKGDLGSFTDGGETSGWAVESVEWAVGAGLLNGMGNNVLSPDGSATRAEAATILMRFSETIAK